MTATAQPRSAPPGPGPLGGSARPLALVAAGAVTASVAFWAAGWVDAAVLVAVAGLAGVAAWLSASRSGLAVGEALVARRGLLRTTTIAVSEVRAVRAVDPEIGGHDLVVVGPGLRSVGLSHGELSADPQARTAFARFVDAAGRAGARVDAAVHPWARGSSVGDGSERGDRGPHS